MQEIPLQILFRFTKDGHNGEMFLYTEFAIAG